MSNQKTHSKIQTTNEEGKTEFKDIEEAIEKAIETENTKVRRIHVPEHKKIQSN